VATIVMTGGTSGLGQVAANRLRITAAAAAGAEREQPHGGRRHPGRAGPGQGASAGRPRLRGATPGSAHLARPLGAGAPRRSDARPMARQRHTRRPERRNNPPASDRHQPDSRRLRRLELGLPGPSRPTDLTMAHTRPSFHLGQFCRRAGGVKMQPPTGGTILTAATTGTPSRPEGRPRRETGQHLVRPRTARPLPRPCHSCCGGRPRDPRPVVAARMAGLGDIRAGPYSSRRGLPRS
jgi:hypothetical protein